MSGVLSFPLLGGKSHPLDCVLDGRHRQVWQRTLVAVEQRLPARKDPHQRLAEKHKHSDNRYTDYSEDTPKTKYLLFVLFYM